MSYTPKINLPGEGVEHARWLEKRSLAQEAEQAAQRAMLDRILKELAALGRKSAEINVSTSQASSGLPAGGKPGQVVRKIGYNDGAAFWSTEVIQSMPAYNITLSSTNPDWYSYAGDGNEGKEYSILPPVSFFDNGTGVGTGLNPILTVDGDQFPVNLLITLDPQSDMEEFFAYLPGGDTGAGNTAPFWTLQVQNLSATNRAVLQIGDARLMYAGTAVPVNGVEDEWELKPKYKGAWFVANAHYQNGTNAATPLTVADGSTVVNNTHPFVFDDFYTQHVRGKHSSFGFTEAGTVTTGVMSAAHYNDRPETQFISLIRATVGTAPAGSALEVDVLVDGVSILSAPVSIAAGATTATLEPDAINWPYDAAAAYTTLQVFPWESGSLLQCEVVSAGGTPGVDLTVQVWAG